MKILDSYYIFKPFIPRRLQLAFRRKMVLRKLARVRDIWPIDERAGKIPEGWPGWPDGKKFALVLTHDVESKEGLEKVLPLARLEQELGFRSCFNFVGRDYPVYDQVRQTLIAMGFEVGLHGLTHNGNLFRSRKIFEKQLPEINKILKEWNAVGFRAPAMYHNLGWTGELDIEYDSSTFDTDPFEPQPDGIGTIFPFWVNGGPNGEGFVELPYTLPQDHILFNLLRELDIKIWKEKLDWIADRGGMAMMLVHPDYMFFDAPGSVSNGYSVLIFESFLAYVKNKYQGLYWNALPKEIAQYYKKEKSKLTSPAQRRMETSKLYESKRKKIWIDLDNTPHVPFFNPIIKELKKQNHEVILTARDCAQTCGMADLYDMSYRRIGRHYGKSKALKIGGTIFRGLQLAETMRSEKPDLAVSHGSRAQMLSAMLLKVPTLAIMDYEHVKGFIHPTWIMLPEVISEGAINHDRGHLIRYPGIKEDVYVPDFKPNSRIRDDLGVALESVMVTVRPPATTAHYHNPEAEILLSTVMERLGSLPDTYAVILPRNVEQAEYLKTTWRKGFSTRKFIIPDNVVDGLNLLWYSDLAISGGGTMNREAAALGVPVYSIFRGKIGDVDRYLSEEGRLVLLEGVEDVQNKLKIEKRIIPEDIPPASHTTLNAVVEGILKALG